MKVYFLSSPRGGKKGFGEHYKVIYKTIVELGHEHVTDFVLEVDVDKFYLSDIKRFYRHTLRDLKRADVCVFETSVHSLAIGHLTAMAIELAKPVIVLATKKKVPFFLSGIKDEKVQIVEYDLVNLKKELRQALEYAREQMDARFNFFISPKIGNYLDWIAKKRKMPRAVYLRRLIEKDMEMNKKYKKS